MKKLMFMFLCLLATYTFVACSDDDEPYIEPVYPERGDESTDERIDVETVVFSSVPADLKEAFNIRCLNIKEDISPITEIAVLPSSELKQNEKNILDLYDKGGMVIIARPNVPEMNSWFKEVGLNYGIFGETDSTEVFAFTQQNQYILSKWNNNTSTNQNLNSFVTWVNKIVRANTSNMPNDAESKIEKIIEGYEIVHEFPFYHSFMETNFGDVIKGPGKIKAKYKIYPVYVFENQPNNGDYYLVSAEVTAENSKLCPDDSPIHYYEVPRVLKAHICGFFLNDLTIKSELKADSRNAEVIFPVGYSPTPLTTQNSTTYSHGKSWNIGGDVTVGGATDKKFSGSICISTGVTYSDQKTQTFSDVNILNYHNGSDAIFKYKVYNLPQYSWFTITPPPAVSVSTATFYEEWIWRVPSTKDYSEETFTLYTHPEVSYGSCHFYTTYCDYKEYVTSPKLPNDIGTAVTPPNRVPTGKIDINNDTEDMYIFDIHLKNLTSNEERVFYVEESLPCGESFLRYIPEGSYEISFMMGETRKSAKRYVLVNDVVHMNRAQKLSLHSSFDFEME